MKRARIIVLVIAFTAAGGAALIAKRMISAPRPVITTEKMVDTVEVLVASKDIRLGDSVGTQDLRWQPWPRSAASSGYITRDRQPKALSNLSGAIARAPFLSGEPIKDQKLIKASEGGVLAAILPSGMRAVSTAIREETAAGGFILPNDRVDVIVSRRVRAARKEEHVSETVLRNVRVLAIGQIIEQKDDKKVVNGKTATLELTIQQAEVLALARSMGELSLALRSLADVNTGGLGGPEASKALGNERSGSVQILKYSVPSQAFGLN